MTPTHCPNCGAAITEENNGKYCLYCGGKMPEPEQNITNNYDNRVENHYHTTNVIVQAPIIEEVPKTIPKPQKKYTKKSGIDIVAIILGLFIFIVGFVGREPYVSIVGVPFIVYGVFHAPKRNYCIKCGALKVFEDRTCTYCGSKQGTPLSTIGIGLVVCVALIIFCIIARSFIK